jgi:hypothetical protein
VQHGTQSAQRVLPLGKMMLGHEPLQPNVNLLHCVVDGWQVMVAHACVSSETLQSRLEATIAP